ncbi:hypothetical protein ABZ543_12815 [Streptomyces roseifaciens]
MSTDFWLHKLQELSGTHAPAPAGLTASGAPWWAHPTYSPAQAPQPPRSMVSRAYQTDRAQSAKVPSTCPNCRGDHYWQPTPSTVAQCADCGYNCRMVHSTAGVAIANTSSAPKRASLYEAQGAGYNPHVIVGRM